MTDSCGCPPEAGKNSCDLPGNNSQIQINSICPLCGKKGKAVGTQTVKALVSISLRDVDETQYFFCRRQDCKAVYFSVEPSRVFTTDQVREQVYQKEVDDNVPVCYCFQHTLGELRLADSQTQKNILKDINDGIQAGQCACDLRNPQGSCCLGNVQAIFKKVKVAP